MSLTGTWKTDLPGRVYFGGIMCFEQKGASVTGIVLAPDTNVHLNLAGVLEGGVLSFHATTPVPRPG